MNSDAKPKRVAEKSRGEVPDPFGAPPRQPAPDARHHSRHSAIAPAIAPTHRSDITGVQVDNLTERETIELIGRLILNGGQHYMSVVNASKLVAAARDPDLRRTLLGSDIVTADGMSVVWASRVFGQPLKERVTGIGVFERLIAASAHEGWRVYLLGARDESVRGMIARLVSDQPHLQLVGFRNGYFPDSQAAEVADEIRESRADVLFVAMGSPRQEKFISKYLRGTGVRFALGVGGAFDHVGGLAKRAPMWMQRAGLEWLYRLWREPRRLWRRYLVGNSVFVWLVVRQLLRKRKSGNAPKAG
jgi:N-acetylglucosaminyldiphosphoundecaprenol N-acetyl-beta-D-mannosaminyltransferase